MNVKNWILVVGIMFSLVLGAPTVFAKSSQNREVASEYFQKKPGKHKASKKSHKYADKKKSKKKYAASKKKANRKVASTKSKKKKKTSKKKSHSRY